MTFEEIEEMEKLRAEAFSSRIEKEIIRTLYNSRTFNPLRPKDILEYLPSELYSSSGSKLAYHLDKLCRSGLVERKRVGRKLTWYSLTEEGTKFYERFPKRRSPDDIVRFLASIIAPYTKGVSEETIRKTLQSLILEKEEAVSDESGKTKEKAE